MAAEGENNKNNEGKGFAGLSSLVSDVDTTPLRPAPKTEPASSTTSMGRPASQAAQPKLQQQPQRQTYQEPPQQSSGSSGGKWILGIAAVVGLLWLIGQSNKSTPSPTPAYSPPAQSATPNYSPLAQPQAPSLPQESMPPVGQNVVLSTAQIRYCLAEDIRMDGARTALNNYSNSDVDRFNAMVADYNSRCGSFRYKKGALESARRDVEPHRGQLQGEGRRRFARSPSTGSLSAPAPAHLAVDETVRAIRQKLNELGYNTDPTDGLLVRGIRPVISAVQLDRSFAATGGAIQALLLQLQQAPVRSSRPQPKTESRPAATSAQSSVAESASLEGACVTDKYVTGAAVYNKCRESQLAAKSGQGAWRPDLFLLSSSEGEPIEAACSTDKYGKALAAYNRCLNTHLISLERQWVRPDHLKQSAKARKFVERDCSKDKYVNGQTSHNHCLNSQLAGLRN